MYTYIFVYVCIYIYIYVYIYTYSGILLSQSNFKKEILPSTKIWMDLGGIMLTEINLTEEDKHCMISLVCRILKLRETTEYYKTETYSQI